MPQRAQRIGERGAPCRHDRRDGDAAQHDGERTRERDGVGRADAEQRTAEQSAEAECRDDADRGANRTEPQASSEEFADDERRGAPSAMRMPISCVLCLTVYDTSP